MSQDEMSGPYQEAIRRGFRFARELDRRCESVHLLVGVAEGDGPAAAALDPGQGRSLRDVVTADTVGAGPGGPHAAGGYLQMQAQGAARSLAESRGEHVSVEHLLIALLDQATAPVLEALTRTGLDPGVVRRMAATAIETPGLPPIELPALTPAGTIDRPPLPASDLDARAWTTLRWRQEHLPVGKLRGPSDREALLHLERAEAWRLADRLGLGDDQRYSLISHHDRAVEQQVKRARPDLPGPPSARDRAQAMALSRRHRRLRRRGILGFTFRHVLVGWGAWFGNRRVGLRDRWFRLRTINSYRDAPQP